MSFLLHRDTCIAAIRGVRRVANRLIQHRGSLHVSAVTVLNLEMWLLRPGTPERLIQPYGALMQQITVADVDDPIAHQAARVGVRFRTQGQKVSAIDLLVAATALVRGWALVTHQGSFFANVPGLTTADWTVP
jgi:predicted nucleic acid-binding protein